MSIDWNRILPVIVSILIIIGIAILRNYSRTAAAIIAVMPINVPLGMWIVYAGEDDGQAALADFSEALLLNIVPSLFFIVVAWQMTARGYGLWETIGVSYVVWAVVLGVVFVIRN